MTAISGSGAAQHAEAQALRLDQIAAEVERDLAKWVPVSPMTAIEESEIRDKCQRRIYGYRLDAVNIRRALWEYDHQRSGR